MENGDYLQYNGNNSETRYKCIPGLAKSFQMIADDVKDWRKWVISGKTRLKKKNVSSGDWRKWSESICLGFWERKHMFQKYDALQHIFSKVLHTKLVQQSSEWMASMKNKNLWGQTSRLSHQGPNIRPLKLFNIMAFLNTFNNKH